MAKKLAQDAPTPQKTTFPWSLDGTNKWFPIDFSINELKNQYGWTHRAIKTHLIQNPLIKDALYKHLTASDMHKFPLPLETEPFLAAFFSMRERPEYKPLFCTYNKREKPSVDIEQFVTDFCLTLRDRLYPLPLEGIPDLDAYCRNIIFENDTFSSVILKDLWKNEINRRMAVIQSMLDGHNPSLQMGVLSECLTALDQCIARFRLSETPPSSPHDKSSLSTMLEQLLEPRGKMKSPDGLIYDIPNIVFSAAVQPDSKTEIEDLQSTHETDLKQAFIDINNRFHPVSDNYIYAARTSYLQYLAAGKNSQTEQEYDHICQYLMYSADPTALSQLKASLEDWTFQLCHRIAHSCTSLDFIWNTPPFDLSQFGYLGALLQTLTSTQMETSLRIFDDTLNTLRTFSMTNIFCKYADNKFQMYQKLSSQSEQQASITSHLFAEPEHSLTRNFALALLNHITPAWRLLFGQEPDFFLADNQIDPLRFTQTFCPAVQHAKKQFDLEQNWDTKTITRHLNTYNQVISNESTTHTISDVLDANLSILSGLVLLMLLRIRSDCIETTLASFAFIADQLAHIGQPKGTDIASK